MSSLQYERFRFSCTIHKLRLDVKFQCEVIFAIKNDLQSMEVESIRSYPLKNGMCQPNQVLKISQQILKNSDGLVESKLLLNIIMISANGKIPVGNISIPTTENGQINSYENEQLQVEKCPNQSAVIFLSLHGQFIQNITNALQSRISSNLMSKNFHNLSVSIANESNIPIKDRMLPISTRYDSSNKKFPLKRRFQPGVKKDKVKSKLGSSFKSGGQFSSSHVSSNDVLSDLRKQERKKQLQKWNNEKQQYLEEISRLKAQNHSIRQWKNEEQRIRYREQVFQITSQMNSYKEKVRQLERKNREKMTTIKSQQDQIQKISSKYSHCQVTKNQQLLIIQEKQKEIKNCLLNLQKLKQENDNINISLNTEEKKNQYKENTYKEQIKRLHQKYKKSDNERQKAVIELNDILQELERSEKKHQNMLKEKQLYFLEEKNMLFKKSQHQNRINEKLQSSKEELYIQNQQLQKEIKNLNLREIKLQQQLSKQRNNYDSLNSDFQKSLLLQKNMQRQNKDLKSKVLQSENLKKNLKQMISENKQIKDKLEKQTKITNKIAEKLNETQEILRNQLNQKSILSTNLFQVTRNIQKMQKQEQSLRKEIQSLSKEVENTSTKNIQLKVRMQNQRYHYEEQLKYLRQQVTYLLKNKDHLIAQLDQLNWKKQQILENYSNIQTKNQQLNQQILKFTQLQLTLEEKINNISAQNKEQESKIEQLKIEKSFLQNKETESAYLLKEKQEAIYNLKKSIKEKEDQININIERKNQIQYHFKQKISELQSQLEIIKKKYEEKLKETDAFEMKLSEKTIEIMKLVDNGNDKLEQIAFYEENFKSFSQKLKKNEKQKEEAKKNQEDLSLQLQNKQNQIQRKNQSIKKYEEEHNQLTQKHQQTCKKTFSAFKILIEELEKQQSSQNNLQSFPDQNMSDLQIKAIKKKQSLIGSYKDKIAEIESEKILLEIQIQKVKQNILERENDFYASINEEKQKNKRLLQEYTTQKNKLSSKIFDLDELVILIRSENQKLSLQIEKQKQIVEEQRKQLHEKSDQITSLIDRLSEMKKEEQTIKLQQQKDRIELVNEYNLQIQNKKKLIEQYKQAINDLQKDNAKLNNIILQKDEKIRQEQSESLKLKYLHEKSQKKLEFLENKNQEGERRYIFIEKQLKNLEKIKREKENIEQSLRKQLEGEKYHHQQKQLQNKQYKNDIDDNMKQISNLKERIYSVSQELNQVKEQKLKITQKYKNELEKLKNQTKKNEEIVIQLNSELELKNFLIEQHQNSLKKCKQQISELEKDLMTKKADGLSQESQIEQLRSQLFFMHENMKNITSDKSLVEEQVQRYRKRVDQLFRNIKQYEILIESFHKKDQKGQKIQEQLQEKQNIIISLEQNIACLKSTVEETKQRQNKLVIKVQKLQDEINKQLSKNNERIEQNHSIQQQLKKKIREMQDSYYLCQEQNNKLKKQMKQFQEASKQQITIASSKYIQLTCLVEDTEQKLKQKDIRVTEYEDKIRRLEEELKKYLNAWNNEKAALRKAADNKPVANKYKQWMQDIERRSQKLIKRSQQQIALN